MPYIERFYQGAVAAVLDPVFFLDRAAWQEVELQGTPAGFPQEADAAAGPAEFLEYIHGAAFSILYQKRFLAFAHSMRNARLVNLLRLHGLENRFCRNGGDIDAPIDWDAVRERTALEVRRSQTFLLESIGGSAE